jgi:hypothetical protein
MELNIKNGKKNRISKSTAEYLKNKYKYDLEKLSILINKNLNDWLL